MMDLKEVAKMIRCTGHELYYVSSTSQGPKWNMLWQRMNSPRPGDMVIELTRIYQDGETGNHLRAVGTLLRVTREPVEPWEDDDLSGRPYEKVWYIRNLAGEEVRWVNADFAAIPTKTRGWA